MFQHYRLASFGFFFLLLMFVLVGSSYTQDLAYRVDKEPLLELKDQGDLPLQLGMLAEKVMEAEHRHRYHVRVESAKYAKLVVIQSDIYVQLKIYDQAGQLLYEQWRYVRGDGSTHTRYVFEKAGEYLLEIGPRNEPLNPGVGLQSKAGKYQLRLDEFRDATPNDFALQQAEKGQNIARTIAGRFLATTVAERKLMTARREYEQGLSAGEAALSVYQRLLQLQPPRERADIGNLALALTTLYNWRDNYSDRERLEQLWEIVARNREEMLGVNNPNSAIAYYFLASYSDPVRGERWIKKALAAAAGSFGEKSAIVAMMLSNWANKLFENGEINRAKETFDRALEIEKTLPQTPEILGDLYVHFICYGNFLLKQGKLAEAEAYLRRAYAQIGDAPASTNSLPGDRHGRRGDLFRQLGELYQAKQDYMQAEIYFKRLLELQTATLTPSLICEANRYLGNMYVAKRDYASAEASYQQAYSPMAKADNAPALALLLRDWARLNLLTGKTAAALAQQKQAFEVTESELQRLLRHGSEAEKLKMMTLANLETNEILATQSNYAPNSPAALELAMTALLLRKGRAQDEIGQTLEAYRRENDQAHDALFDELLDKQNMLARLSLFSWTEKDADKHLLENLTQEVDELQIKLSERRRQTRTTAAQLSLQAVQSALPARTGLVEYIRYSEAGDKAETKARYLAYILMADGRREWTDLGPARRIEYLAQRWLASIQTSQQGLSNATEHRRLARQLDALIMQPVYAKLGDIRQVFLSPDGLLHLIPFAALLDQQGRERVRDLHLIYLTSGRDLLRLPTKKLATEDVLIVGAPDYDSREVATAPVTALAEERAGRMSRSISHRGRFEPLPQARAEAQAIQVMFPQARLLLGPAATESAVKQVHRPAIMHLITHGVFLPDQASGQNRDASPMENPLLRSWLALAGANQRQSGANGQEEDGILTAYEAAALDLWGTKLVVLSACETGLGEIKNGEGVYGLRRALVLAGAETQVTSLWRVNDRVTKNLMSQYYSKLKQGMGRVEALRQVQLAMLQSKGNSHPYYWASFIALGEWANLAGQR